jgi:hypothetical protein
MSITTSTPNRRLRTTLAAAGLAVAATAGLGFSALGAAHAEDAPPPQAAVHVTIQVDKNSVPADQTPTVAYTVNGTTTCDVAKGATPTFELNVPEGTSIQLESKSGCNGPTVGSAGIVAHADMNNTTVGVAL